jgi:hypothetical protein
LVILSIANKPCMLNVIMLNVIMLSVVAPLKTSSIRDRSHNFAYCLLL